MPTPPIQYSPTRLQPGTLKVSITPLRLKTTESPTPQADIFPDAVFPTACVDGPKSTASTPGFDPARGSSGIFLGHIPLSEEDRQYYLNLPSEDAYRKKQEAYGQKLDDSLKDQTLLTITPGKKPARKAPKTPRALDAASGLGDLKIAVTALYRKLNPGRQSLESGIQGNNAQKSSGDAVRALLGQNSPVSKKKRKLSTPYSPGKPRKLGNSDSLSSRSASSSPPFPFTLNVESPKEFKGQYAYYP